MKTGWLSVVAALAFWVLWVVFAHDWVSNRINHTGQSLETSLNQGDGSLVWEWLDDQSLVKDFGSGWALDAGALQVNAPRADVSLRLNQQILMPKWHDQIQFNVRDAMDGATIQIELSNLQETQYYYSPRLPLVVWQAGLTFEDYDWQVVGDGVRDDLHISWEEMPPIHTLVFRLKAPGKARSIIDSVVVSQGKTSSSMSREECAGSWWSCHFSNSMRWQHQRHQAKTDRSWLGFQPVLNQCSWFWVVVGMLVIIGVFYTHRWLLVWGLLISVGGLALHWPISVEASQVIYGLSIPSVALLFWVFRQFLCWPRNPASVVWFVTGLLGAMMWAASGWESEFLKALPMYFIWAMAQQLLLGPLASTYLKKQGFSQSAVMIWIGVIFSVTHSPNHGLMIATLLGGCFWSWCWLKYQNIYANAASHAILALLFYQLMPAQWFGNARIGGFF